MKKLTTKQFLHINILGSALFGVLAVLSGNQTLGAIAVLGVAVTLWHLND